MLPRHLQGHTISHILADISWSHYCWMNPQYEVLLKSQFHEAKESYKFLSNFAKIYATEMKLSSAHSSDNDALLEISKHLWWVVTFLKLCLHRANDGSGINFEKLMTSLSVHWQWRMIFLSTDHPLTVSALIDRFSNVVHERPRASMSGSLTIHWPSIDHPLSTCGPFMNHPCLWGVNGWFSPFSSTSSPWSMTWRSVHGQQIVRGYSWPIYQCSLEEINQYSLSTGHSRMLMDNALYFQ